MLDSAEELVLQEQCILPEVDIDRFVVPKVKRIRTSCGWNPKLRYNLVQSVEHLDHMIATLRAEEAQGIAWDTETSGLKPELGARIAGHCFCTRTGERELTGWYVPIRHIGETNRSVFQLPPEVVNARLRPLFATGGEVLTYHAKFDMKLARADNLWLTRPVSDIAIEATAYNENEQRFGLKYLAAKYCTSVAKGEQKRLEAWMRKDARKLGLVFKKHSPKQRKKLKARGLDELSSPTYMQRFGYARAPVPLAAVYGIHDAFYTWWLSAVKYRHIRTQYPALWEREHRVMHMLCDMEWHGQEADPECICDTHARTKVGVEFWRQECQRLLPGVIDDAFEVADPALRTLFYETLRMEVPKHTKSGKPSVDKEARLLLEKRYPHYAPLLKALGSLARVSKLHTTYAGNYLRYYSPQTGTINPCYNQLEERSADGGAPVTGRLSSSDPNGQNVSKKPLHLWNCGCKKCIQDRAVELAVQWWGWDEKVAKAFVKPYL